MFKPRQLTFNEPNPNHIWRDSLIACGAALALFMATAAIDVAAFYGRIRLPPWLSVGGADDARALMSALLSSVCTVLALMFTVIMLVLSIAATWFGPRLMSRFLRQSYMASSIMGLFLASFVQCVLTLIAIREWERVTWVPQVTILTTIAVAVASFFALVYFCHRIAQAIQMGNVLTILVADVRRVLRDLPASTVIDPAARRIAPAGASQAIPKAVLAALTARCQREGAPIRAERSGYLQEIDRVPLFLAADRADAVVHLTFRPGQFVTRGSTLAHALPAERGAALAGIVDRCHVLGRQRTLKQDLEFGMAQLVEIALRALSAAINDSFTGMYCVDWLGDCLIELAAIAPMDGAWTTPSGTIRLLEPPLRFSRFVTAGFAQIRQVAPQNPALTIRLFQTFARLLSQLEPADARRAVTRQVEALWEMAATEPMARADREDVEAAYALAREAASPAAAAPALHPADALTNPG